MKEKVTIYGKYWNEIENGRERAESRRLNPRDTVLYEGEGEGAAAAVREVYAEKSRWRRLIKTFNQNNGMW